MWKVWGRKVWWVHNLKHNVWKLLYLQYQVPYKLRMFYSVKVKVLLNLQPHLREIGFHGVQLLSFPANTSTAIHPLQLGRLEQCEWSFLLKETQLLELPQYSLTFSIYTAGLTGVMWVKFLLKEATTTNSIIWESNQVLLDHRPIPNHCCCCPSYNMNTSC